MDSFKKSSVSGEILPVSIELFVVFVKYKDLWGEKLGEKRGLLFNLLFLMNE